MWQLLFISLVLFSSVQGRKFNNPVLGNASYPDPGVILYDGVYYAVTTTNNNIKDKYPIHSSTDLQTWTQIGQVFDESNIPKWAKVDGEFYAPEIHQINDEFRVYFTARDTEADVLTIGVATSKNVTGPFSSMPQPLLVVPNVYVLDSTIIKHENLLMLTWVESQYIRARNLTKDGLAFADNETALLITPELPWEGETTEGPWHIYRNGYHYMFYSANNYCSDKYALGVARSKSPTGPYEKYPQPLLVSNDEFKGPGHGSIVRDTVNNGWAFIHHAWKTGFVCTNGSYRVMLATSMEWGNNDWPLHMSIGN